MRVKFKSPCLDCTERSCGCHAHCERFAERKADFEREKAEVIRQKALEHVADWITYESRRGKVNRE